MALTKITKTGITADAIDATKIADNAIETAQIKADAVNATKIADDSISEEHLDVTSITGHTELSAQAADDDILLVFDTSAGTLKKIQASNVGTAAVTITSISPTSVVSGDGTGNHTFVITGKNYAVGTTANLVNSSGTDVSFDTLTRNSSTQLTGVIAKSSLLNSGEPFDIKVIGVNGTNAILTDQISVDASPTFVTASGTLGTFTEGASVSVSVNATDPESAGNVTFEIQSGSLPAGLTLTNTAAEGGTAIISGTASDVPANTTSNFVLRAIDAASNTSSRSFSITINHVVTSTSFTSSGTFSVPSGVTNIDSILVIAGGGAGGGDNGGGGGAGGLIFMPDYPVAPSGTITVTIGCGGTGSPGEGIVGQDSAFGSPGDPGLGCGGVLTAKGGGRGRGASPGAGGQGGSGGGANGHYNNCQGGCATQPTQPGNSGAYGFGFDGRASSTTLRRGGAGGGAGGLGTASGNYAGQGGVGKAYTIGDGTTPVAYAGGSGGASNAPNTHGQGSPCGTGGRGGSPDSSPTKGISGTANRGGAGGGGMNNGSCNNCGGGGGKGIIIVRY